MDNYPACGCRIDDDGVGMCNLHAAAPKLLAVLVVFRELFAYDPEDSGIDTAVLKCVDAAIKEAKK